MSSKSKVVTSLVLLGTSVLFTFGSSQQAAADSGPVLGQPMDTYSVGFGEARPAQLSQNSMCGNTITGISWSSWGGPTAQGAGLWCQSAGAVSRGEAPKPVSLTASDLGSCNGVLAYRTLRYDSGETIPVCLG